ncbi:AsnC family transcriptional regulator [Mesorhizobium sp. M0808]|uniref:Lrp/AsnC family transcriptional regulator n=1 Tax=Mesorhizobium sp. M0808 TaxID=2957002 RepID=UPI00333D26EE
MLRRILTALQKNNRLSFAELAELLGSSAASCMRRVNKLRSDRVIVAESRWSIRRPLANCSPLSLR